MNKFIDFSGKGSWTIDKVLEVVTKIKAYTDKKGYDNVRLFSVEDNTWSDPVNERYDIELSFTSKGKAYTQKLLILKGEVLDGTEFHKRFSEFY